MDCLLFSLVYHIDRKQILWEVVSSFECQLWIESVAALDVLAVLDAAVDFVDFASFVEQEHHVELAY